MWGGMARGTLVALMVITILITWGVFIYAVVKEDIPPSSVAFDMLLAQTIASTILAIITFALSITIVGMIIVAIVAVIDVILTILGKDWTISGWVTVGDSSFLGTNCTVRDGLTIAPMTLVGAGVVVTADTEEGQILAPPQARILPGRSDRLPRF